MSFSHYDTSQRVAVISIFTSLSLSHIFDIYIIIIITYKKKHIYKKLALWRQNMCIPSPCGDDDDKKGCLTKAFDLHGYLKLPLLLSLETCQRLRDYIIDDLETTLKQPEELQSHRFSSIRKRTNRWDLKLHASPLVKAAMQEVLLLFDDIHGCDGDQQQQQNFLQTLLAPIFQCETHDLVLAELGSLITDPGAPAQDWHADSVHTGQSKRPDCICCFITLQDTPATMGPTEILPETHTLDFHNMALANFPPKGLLPSTVSPKTMLAGYEHAGEACLMDCRLYHRGAANTHHSSKHLQQEEEEEEAHGNSGGESPLRCNDGSHHGRRVVFYFSVRSAKKPAPGGLLFTIMDSLKDMHVVDFLEK
jgi:Phytanoyl-CoA dioxygenase (PhyH)